MNEQAKVIPLWLADRQSCAAQHTPCPSGYVAWHAWAEVMAKTHEQQQCPECHLWAIWTPKPDPLQEARWAT